MHLLSHHAPTGAWYFVYTKQCSIIVVAYYGRLHNEDPHSVGPYVLYSK